MPTCLYPQTIPKATFCTEDLLSRSLQRQEQRNKSKRVGKNKHTRTLDMNVFSFPEVNSSRTCMSTHLRSRYSLPFLPFSSVARRVKGRYPFLFQFALDFSFSVEAKQITTKDRQTDLKVIWIRLVVVNISDT